MRHWLKDLCPCCGQKATESRLGSALEFLHCEPCMYDWYRAIEHKNLPKQDPTLTDFERTILGFVPHEGYATLLGIRDETLGSTSPIQAALERLTIMEIVHRKKIDGIWCYWRAQ